MKRLLTVLMVATIALASVADRAAAQRSGSNSNLFGGSGGSSTRTPSFRSVQPPGSGTFRSVQPPGSGSLQGGGANWGSALQGLMQGIGAAAAASQPSGFGQGNYSPGTTGHVPWNQNYPTHSTPNYNYQTPGGGYQSYQGYGDTPAGPYYQGYGDMPAGYGAAAPAAAPPANPAPAVAGAKAVAPPPAVVKTPVQPVANEVRLKGRVITAGEIQASKAFFAGQFQDLTQRLQQELKDSFVEQSRLIQELSAKSVAADLQSQILEAVRDADAAQTQILWSTATKDIAGGANLYKQVSLQQALKSLGAKAVEGSLSADEVRRMRDAVSTAGLAVEKKNAALDLIGQLESRVKIATATRGAVPGQPDSVQNLPAGAAPIIFNPKLPAQTAVALGNGYVMIGTGGRGEMELVTGEVAAAMGLPVSDGTPTAPSSAEEPAEGVVLINSPDSGTTVYYTIQGNEYNMGPGYTHTLPYAAVTVNFNRGGSFGRKEYALSPGTYRFTGTDQGWELYARDYRLTIDNTGNPYEFRYVADNQRAVVGPGQVKEHTSKFPLLVRFDRGNGTATKQVYVEQGVLKVAVNSQDGLWDVFLPEKAAGIVGSASFAPAF